jgi:membrane protease YdiL (CAAX protease family)
MIAIHAQVAPTAARMDKRAIPRPLPIAGSFVLFALPTILMWLATRVGIPWLREHLSGPEILCWFIAGGVVFAGLFKAALLGFWVERRQGLTLSFRERFRFGPLRRMDVLLAVAALVICGLLSGTIHLTWEYLSVSTGLLHRPELSPPFVRMEPLTAQTAWVLLAWLPLFFFNIAGEELWWRGYVLVRQERRHGNYACLVHAAGLALFHLPLGIDLTIILTPFLIALPWVVTRQQSIWPGFILHGLLNGGGFLAVAGGLA